MQVEKSKLVATFAIVRSFNVAAICALAIWNAYAFYLNQAMQQTPGLRPVELQFVSVAATDTSQSYQPEQK